MNKPLVGAVFGLLLIGATAAPATAVGAQHEAKARAKAVTFAGTVALSNCSGSVVRVPDSQPTDPALVMSNGHCLESGFPGPGEVVVDQPSSRTFSLLNSAGSKVATLRADKIAYGTMTDTDVSLYQLTSTYEQIESSYGIKALELSASHPTAGTAITVVSGYWKKTYSCNIDGFAYRLKEGEWTWKDSVRYTSDVQHDRRHLGLPRRRPGVRQGRRGQQHGQRGRRPLHGQQPVRGRRERHRHGPQGHQLRAGDVRDRAVRRDRQQDRPERGGL